MKKTLFLMFLIFLFILSSKTNSYAAYFESGNYLEKYQWGALEDIMADWKTGQITTDECVIYGCHVFAALEPARFDKKTRAKLLPSKYRLDKKSVEEGPYFFVYGIYKNENLLGKKALEEFRNSEWSDYEFIEDIIKNEKFIQIIISTSFEYYGEQKYRDYYNICVKSLQSNSIMPQSIIYAKNLAHSGVNIQRYKEKIKPFNEKYMLGFDSHNRNFLDSLFLEFSNDTKFQSNEKKILKDRKLTNLINYLFYSRYKVGGIPTFYKDGFRVTGIELDSQIVKQYSDWLNYYKEKMLHCKVNLKMKCLICWKNSFVKMVK